LAELTQVLQDFPIVGVLGMARPEAIPTSSNALPGNTTEVYAARSARLFVGAGKALSKTRSRLEKEPGPGRSGGLLPEMRLGGRGD
jgi:hypothetical protein